MDKNKIIGSFANDSRINSILAKSKEHGGATLLEHSVECAVKCLELAEASVKPGTECRDSIIDMCVFAGLFHDIGKVSDDFQKRVRGESCDIVCVHNVASVKFITKYLKVYCPDENATDAVYAAIVNHHPIIESKSNVINSSECDSESVTALIHALTDIYRMIRPNSSISITEKENPSDSNYKSRKDYYQPENNMYNVYLFGVGNILKYADIITSSSDSIQLPSDNIFNNINIIEHRPEHYDGRFEIQYEMAKRLSGYNISCFNSQTGFGKTMLGLMYILMNGKRGYWVCPRNTIARSVYNSVCEEIRAMGLSDKVNVALLLSNVYEHGGNDSDIIVTNIDNYSRPQFKTDANIRSFDIMDSTCVFDEFHEFLTSDAILASFDVSMSARKRFTGSHTLMMSATPIPMLYEDYIDSGDAYIKYDCESILSRHRHIIFGEETMPKNLKGMNYFICTNSVSKCQDIFMDGSVDNVIHARYTDSDRNMKNEELYLTHGKSAYREGTADGSSWSGNRVISTGCDVSFNNIAFYNVIPEMFVQGLGRNDRWGIMENSGIVPDVYMIYNKKGDVNERAAVNAFYDGSLVRKFYEFMQKKFGGGRVITLKDIYDVRDEFYSLDDVKSQFRRYFGDIMEKSYRNLSKINYSYSVSKFDDDNQSGAVYISNKPSLRGGSDNYSMWIMTYEGGMPTMKEPMQSDDAFIDLDSIFDERKYRANIMRVIEKNGLVKEYFKNTRTMDAVLMKKPTQAKEKMKSLALSSETPMIVTNLYAYDEKIGLYKKKD